MTPLLKGATYHVKDHFQEIIPAVYQGWIDKSINSTVGYVFDMGAKTALDTPQLQVVTPSQFRTEAEYIFSKLRRE